MKKSAPVLIVGAGPTGLALALSLHRDGVPFRIIDKSPKHATTSRALGIQVRTLEMLDGFGLADAFVSAGNPVTGVVFHDHANTLGEIHLDRVASSFPHALILPQSETEALLEQALVERGVTIERPAELLGLKQRPDSVLCKVRDTQEVIEEIEFQYVIGCDGAHSSVRHSLGIEFRGEGYPEFFGLADVRVKPAPPIDKISIFFNPKGPVVFFPIREGLFRVVTLLEGSAADNGITLEELEEIVSARLGVKTELTDAEWITGFRTHHRRAARFQSGRVFLAGDAAHVHSPAGGQGMNTGMQDAWNLGWKIASVVREDSAPCLLSSYEAERFPVADHVLEVTDRMFRFATLREPAFMKLREKLLPWLASCETLEQTMANDLSQISVAYRNSPLTTECRGFFLKPGQMHAGDRLPDLELISQDGQRCRLYEKVRAPGFHLFVAPGSPGMFGSTSYGSARHFADQLIEDFHGQLHVHWVLTPIQSTKLRNELPDHYVDSGGVVAHRLGIHPSGAVLIRPDLYCSFGSHGFDAGALRLSLLSYWI